MRLNEEMVAERDLMERIVALLLALAGLADRAAFASSSTRYRVLWALQEANAAALELIAGRSFNLAGQHWSPALVTTRYGTAPADAMSLGVALRALAFLVNIMAVRIRTRSTGHPALACADDSRQPSANRSADALSAVFPTDEVCDTS